MTTSADGPPLGGPPSDATAGLPPVVLSIAMDLVTRHRLRLADQRDSRLGSMAGRFVLAAASWTGPRAALVGFYNPPADPEQARDDLDARCRDAFVWAGERLQVQGAQRCDILLVALRRVPSPSVEPSSGAIQIGVAWVDAEMGAAEVVTSVPGDMPRVRDLRNKAREVRGGAPIPTLAQVDLAERQTVAGGYAAPVRSAIRTTPLVSYVLVGAFVAVWLLQQALPTFRQASSGGINVGIGADTFVNLPAFAPDWWRYITSAFLHVGLVHLAVNSYSMLILGRLVEQLYGRLVMLGVFLLTAAGGCGFWLLAHILGPARPGIGVGASGGLCGLLGLVSVLGRVQGRNTPPAMAASLRAAVVQNVVLLALMGFFFPQINNFVHVGGFLSGALLGLVLPPLEGVGGRRVTRPEQAVLVLVVAVSAAALVAGAFQAQQLAGTIPPN